MKIQYLNKLVSSHLQKTIHSHNYYSNRVSASFFCTQTLTNPSSSSSSSPSPSLFNRVKLVQDPKASVLPVLTEWVNEGRPVTQTQLQWLVRNIKDFRRFHHALEISTWMTDSMFHQITPRDAAIRLELIYKVHGLEDAESYFNTLSNELKKRATYGALLHCYAHNGFVEKAEATMTEMRDKGFTDTSFPYNVLVDLYLKAGEFNKVDKLMEEMTERGIPRDRFTLRNLILSYIKTSNVSGIEKVLSTVKEQKNVAVDLKLYSVAADGYLKLGVTNKALEILQRLEKECEKRNVQTRIVILSLLITLYPRTGKKKELYRVWNKFNLSNVYTSYLYARMISSLLKLDDIEGSERIFKEWESRCDVYDFKVVNRMLSGYCNKGLLEKAESMLKRCIERGGNAFASSWNILATGFVDNGQIPEAIGALKNGLVIGRKKCLPSYATMASCLDYLKLRGDSAEIEEILTSLRKADVLSEYMFQRLFGTRDDAAELCSAILCQTDVNRCSNSDEKLDSKDIDGSSSDKEESDELFWNK